MSLQTELDALDTYIAKQETWTTPGVPYRLILALGLAHFSHGTRYENDAYRSHLGMLTKYIGDIQTDYEKTKDGKRKVTYILAFDPRFDTPMPSAGKSRLEYDIEKINKQVQDAMFSTKKEDRALQISSAKRFYPKQDTNAYFLGINTILLCFPFALETSYPISSNVNSAREKIGQPLSVFAKSCPPKEGTNYSLLLQFCQKHSFEEIGIYNCAYEDLRTANYSIRKNKYFDTMCELLYIAYTCGKHSFLLDTTMGSISHPNSLITVNRRRKTNPYNFRNNTRRYEDQTAFLTVFPLNEKTVFKRGYSTGTYEGGTRRHVRKKTAKSRKWRK